MRTAAAAADLCAACLLTLALAPEDLPADEGDRIGPYRIVETLGEGGMGIVYLAEQESPIRRRVALKVIKVGMDTHEVVARFESERQALALMDHPHIARVFDAGASDDGRPYFAMEYVPGLPITEFCDQQACSTQARLVLVQQVCAAVQHAHQRGVLHRDLKPSNVLVMSQDGVAVPKVIDFGIAKAIEQDVLQQTLFTEHGRLLGTPEYMSPEQASLGAVPVDTRTDIYSLGVLLYELLVGALPFEPAALRHAGYDEMRRVIREVEPVRPSTRVSTLGAMAGAAAVCRGTRADTLEKQLRGDLDWIALKALEKDPARRYASASELSADIAHHLANEPVAAGPPGASYRIRKFIRKHRAAVTVASVFVILLATATLSSTLLFLRAENARREADRRRLQTDEARVATEQQRRAADAARIEAQDARSDAVRQRDDAERRSYAANLLAADLSLQAGELREAKRHLELCALRLRGWEWRHLRLATDASVTTLSAHDVQKAVDRRLRVSSFDGVGSQEDSKGALALSLISGAVPALNEFTSVAGGRATQPIPGGIHVDPATSIVAVSGDRRWVLATRWMAYGTRFDPTRTGPDAGNADWSAVNDSLSVEDRSTLIVLDPRSGKTVATLALPQAGRRRFSGLGPLGPTPTRRPSDPLGIVRLQASPVSISGQSSPSPAGALATVGYPIVVRGVLNHDGSRAAAWSWDNVIHLWDVPSGRQLSSLVGHTDFIAQAVFTPDSGRLVSASYDGTVRVWDLETFRAAAVLANPAGRVPFTAIATASTGSAFAAGSEDGIISVWRNEQERPQLLSGHHGRVNALALTRDGVNLVSASRDRTLRVWNTQSGTEILKLQGHEDDVSDVRISENGRLIASASADHTIRLWNLRAPVDTLPFSGPASPGMAFVDGSTKLVLPDGRAIQVWDLQSGAIARQVPLVPPVASLDVSPDGRRIAIGLQIRSDIERGLVQSSGAALLVDAGTLRTSTTLPNLLRPAGLMRRVGSIGISDDGARIVTGSNDDAVRLWDSMSGRVLAEWTASGRDVVQRPGDSRGYPFYSPPVAMRPDGSVIAASLTHREITVWRLRGDRWVAEPPAAAPADWITALAFTRDGGRIVFGDISGVVTVWDVPSAEPIGTLRGHDASTDAIALSPDGDRIATGGVDRTVRIWDANTYELLLTLRTTAPVLSLAFSPDGERLAARLSSGPVLIWYASPQHR